MVGIATTPRASTGLQSYDVAGAARRQDARPPALVSFDDSTPSLGVSSVHRKIQVPWGAHVDIHSDVFHRQFWSPQRYAQRYPQVVFLGDQSSPRLRIVDLDYSVIGASYDMQHSSGIIGISCRVCTRHSCFQFLIVHWKVRRSFGSFSPDLCLRGLYEPRAPSC